MTERLQYVAKALPLIKTALGGRTALLGFAGSPWTLANFMIEGGGVKEYTKAKALFYADPRLFERLLEKLTRAVTDFLQLQIDAGVDAVQIFDSLGGVLSDGAFAPPRRRWMQADHRRAEGQGAGNCVLPGRARELGRPGGHRAPQVLGVDWNVGLADVRARLPARVAVQGNLDPFLLTTTPGGGRGRDRPDPGANARAARPYLQPRPRRAARRQTGKHREPGEHCEQTLPR